MSYFFVLLLRLVAYFEGVNKVYLFTLVCLLFGATIGWNILKKGKIPKFILNTIIYSTIIFAVVLLHTVIFSSLSVRDFAVLTTFYLWFTFLITRFWNTSIDESLKYILISFLLFNLTNYLYNEFFFYDARAGINSILAIFGIHGYRIYFPLSSGANINAAQVGLSSLVAVYLYIKTPRGISKGGYLAVVVFHFMLLVLADSRLILLVTLMFSALVFFSFKKVINFLRKYWLLISLTIIGAMYIFYTTDILEFMKRSGEKSGSATNRFEIWQIAIDIIIQDFRIISGHGLNGFENSLETNLRASFSQENLQTSHNFILQTVIDFGVVGVLLSFYVIRLLIVKAHILGSYILKILMVAILIYGTTESIPTFYSFEATLYFLGVAAVIITQYERGNHQST